MSGWKELGLSTRLICWSLHIDGRSTFDDLWPATHRKKSQTNFRKYDYDYRQKSNLFNIDSLYRKMPKKTYTKGGKQEFEILIMYHWLHNLEGDDSGYWQEYLEKDFPAIKPGNQ